MKKISTFTLIVVAFVAALPIATPRAQEQASPAPAGATEAAPDQAAAPAPDAAKLEWQVKALEEELARVRKEKADVEQKAAAPGVQLTAEERTARLTSTLVESRKKIRESAFAQTCKQAGGKLKVVVGSDLKLSASCEL